jgi:hypothetical protein
MMGKRLLSGISAALVSSVGLLHPVPASADGPGAAYDSATVDASLDPGEVRITADVEIQARLKDLREAYHYGYDARAKEDAETYAALHNRLKNPPKHVAEQRMPPLPKGKPNDGYAQATAFRKPQIIQRTLPVQPQYRQAHERPQYAPPRTVQYRPPKQYATAAVHAQMPQEYKKPVYAERVHAPPAQLAQATQPARDMQYIPVDVQPAYVPRPPAQAMVQPVIMIGHPPAYPAYRQTYAPLQYRRPDPAG